MEGVKREDIARIVGVHPSTLGGWIALYNGKVLLRQKASNLIMAHRTVD